MYMIAVILVVSILPSTQLIVHDHENQSYDLSRSVRRSNEAVLRPTELFLCALKAKGIYSLRSICERSHQLQQEAHHCSSRTLLMMRIDHHLADLQRLVMLTVFQKVLRRAGQCSSGNSISSGIDDLKTDIALLQEQHVNLTRHQSKLTCVLPNLQGIKNNLTEAIEVKKFTHWNIKSTLQNLSQAIENSKVSIGNFSEVVKRNRTSTNEMNDLRPNLIECGAKLDSLIANELNCSAEILPKLQDLAAKRTESLQGVADNIRALQGDLQTCRLMYLQCQDSDICDRVQTTIVKANQSGAELEQVTDQLAGCSSVLTSLDQGITRCEAARARAHRTHSDLLVNVTTQRIRRQQLERAVMDCESQLSTCHENTTVCADLSAELEHSAAGCWADLDKWKFRTDLCEGQAAMLLQNVNATADYIGDMRAKLRTDQADLEVCQDRQLYHKSGHVQATHELGQLAPQLNASRDSLAACLAECPHLRKPPSASRCPVTDHGLSWHQGTSGCFFVTRPGAGRARMRQFCAEQAPGATVARLSSETMAKEAYAALLERYMSAARTEPLRSQRRAWVDFEDGFEYAGFPARSPQCQLVTCACWTMRFPWNGRSQLYECEQVNLPAICFVPKTPE